MEHKPIYVDGVDLSGCKYFCLNQMGNNCLNHNQGFSMNCNNNNCYYKQLKRKEQECEELKKANDGILTTIRILAKNNIKLREILTEIKEIANYSFNRTTSEYMAKLELISEKINEVQNDEM